MLDAAADVVSDVTVAPVEDVAVGAAMLMEVNRWKAELGADVCSLLVDVGKPEMNTNIKTFEPGWSFLSFNSTFYNESKHTVDNSS